MEDLCRARGIDLFVNQLNEHGHNILFFNIQFVYVVK